MIVQAARHHRPEWEARLFSRQGREAAYTAQIHQCTRTLGERGLGNWRLVSLAGPDPACFLADEGVITVFSPMFLRRADPRRRQDPEA